MVQQPRTTETSNAPAIARRTRVSRRSILSLAAAAAALPACRAGGQRAPAEQAGAPALQPATIEWYKYLNPAQAQQAPQFLDQFHATNPEITVKLTIRPGGAAEYMEKLVAMVVAGQPPDVLQIHGAAYLAVMLGLAQDISDLFRRDKIDTSKFNQLLFEYGSQWLGKTYGLPFANQAEAVALIYDRNQLQAAGLAEPPERWNDPSWTWERFVEMARRLVRIGPDGRTAVHGLNRSGAPC